jgi:hypothetical protein
MHHGRNPFLSPVDFDMGEELFSEPLSIIDAHSAASFVPRGGKRPGSAGHFHGYQHDWA